MGEKSGAMGNIYQGYGYRNWMMGKIDRGFGY